MLFSEIGLAQHQLQNSVCCLGLAFNFVIVQCDVSGIGGGGGGAGGWVTVCVCVCVCVCLCVDSSPGPEFALLSTKTVRDVILTCSHPRGHPRLYCMGSQKVRGTFLGVLAILLLYVASISRTPYVVSETLRWYSCREFCRPSSSAPEARE